MCTVCGIRASVVAQRKGLCTLKFFDNILRETVIAGGHVPRSGKSVQNLREISK